MTSTDKPVSRVTRAAYRVTHSDERQLVVQIGPGDVLTFREKGRRATWSITIPDAFRGVLYRRAGV